MDGNNVQNGTTRWIDLPIIGPINKYYDLSFEENIQYVDKTSLFSEYVNNLLSIK